MDAIFVHVVEVGQYFMTKDTGDFKQFHTVACREYTLPRDDGICEQRQFSLVGLNFSWIKQICG